MVYKFYNDFSLQLSNDYIGGEFHQPNYPTFGSVSENGNKAQINSVEVSFEALDELDKKMSQVCKNVQNIISIFRRLSNNISDVVDSNELKSCIILLNDNIKNATASVIEMTTSFQKGLNNLNNSIVFESNNPNNERDTNESLDKAIEPISSFLLSLHPQLYENFNNLISSIKEIHHDEYKKLHQSVDNTDDVFYKSVINQIPFKAAVYETLKKSQLWYLIMSISMYVPGYEKLQNYLEPIISKGNSNINPTRNNTNANVLKCISSILNKNKDIGNGEDDENDTNNNSPLNKLNSFSHSVLKNIRSGYFTCSNGNLYGGADLSVINPRQNIPVADKSYKNGEYDQDIEDPRKSRINDDYNQDIDPRKSRKNVTDFNKIKKESDVFSSSINKINEEDMSEEIKQLLQELNMNISKFSSLKETCIHAKTILMEKIHKYASINSLFQEATKMILSSTESRPFESTLFFTSNDKIYYQIMLNLIKNDTKFNKNYQQYMPAIQFARLAISKLFPSLKTNENNKSELLTPVISKECETSVVKYFNVNNESEYIKYIISIIDCLNHIIIKPYVNRTGTNITVFCVINDFESNPNDKSIYRKVVDSDMTNLLETVPSLSCRDLNNMSIVRNNSVNVTPNELKTELTTIKIPFTFIFERCDLSMIPYYIKIAERIKERQHTCMLTFGYSGTGKSVTTMGKVMNTPNNGVIYSDGILQHALRSLKEEFYVEVLEIYGRALPSYESFNNDNSNNDDLLKSISWIKIYTDDNSVQSNGIYKPETVSDYFDEDNFDYITSGNKGDLIKDPIKIKEYFKNRLTNNHIKTMYNVKTENVMDYLQNFSDYLVEPIEKKRRQLRTIFFTPNNPDSSRSILLYTLAFKTGETFTTLTIADFPGKENPVPTYIIDSPRDISGIKEKIASGYGNQYSSETVDLYLKKFSETIQNRDTLINLIPFNPLIFTGIAPIININIIEAINTYIHENIQKLNASKMRDLKRRVFAKKIESFSLSEFFESEDKIKYEYYNSNHELVTTDVDYSYMFPQLYDFRTKRYQGSTTLDNRNDSFYTPNITNDFKVKSSVILQTSYRSDAGFNPLRSPNNIRMYYITFIFEELLKMNEFSNNDLIVILLKALNKSFSYKSRGDETLVDKLFGQVDNIKYSKYFCTRMNNMFEAFFINEVVALIIRDSTLVTTDYNTESYSKQNFQGNNLKMIDMTNYTMKRILSLYPNYKTTTTTKFKNLFGVERTDIEKLIGNISKYNPLTNYDINNQEGKIYQILSAQDSYLNDESDYNKLKRDMMNFETSKLYNYSKLLSESTKNNILNLLHLPPDNSFNNKLAVYILYVVSSVQSDLKCESANTLLESMIPTLECLVLGKCKRENVAEKIEEDNTYITNLYNEISKYNPETGALKTSSNTSN